MSKLLQRLSDPAKSGVYKTSRIDEILAATRGSGLRVARVGLSGSKDRDAVLARLAAVLEFPKWFGGNWDALEDSLGDLSWRQGEGHLLLFSGYPRGERPLLIDVLRSSAEYWAGRGKPFFAVFVDPARELPLPDLYRDA